MSRIYAERKAAQPAKRPAGAGGGVPGGPIAQTPPPAGAGNARPVDLPGAIKAKMEASSGAELTAVKLYESEAVAEGGAQAVARGNRIAFAPGALDFASAKGQALLGHEISHVVSQARGEARGGGHVLY